MKKILVAVFALLLFAGCSKKDPAIPAVDLGGGVLFDPSIMHPENYLISASNPHPTASQAQAPVIIACHGFTATTFEWDEFKTWSSGMSGYQISQVLLGGHGVTYDEFKKSTWHDWQASIIREYNTLVSEGYKNINFTVSSTSCPLVLDMIHSGMFNNATTTVHIFMVDPIVIAANKSLSLVGVLGPVLGYVTSDNAPGEEKYYYHFRPQETLQQLQDILNVSRAELQDGIKLPQNVYLKVYKSLRDNSADPVSAVLIYNGVKTFDGKPIDLDLINSNIHVFTRLNLVPNVTALDKQNQLYAFSDITTRVFK